MTKKKIRKSKQAETKSSVKKGHPALSAYLSMLALLSLLSSRLSSLPWFPFPLLKTF